MKNISDNKALSLQAVSRSLKQMAGVATVAPPALYLSACPNWTARFERAISSLSIKQLDEIEFLLEILRAGVATKTLPA